MAGLKQIMSSLYKIKPGILIRPEYFGGLIIDTNNNVYYQIPKYDTLVLFSLKYVSDIDAIRAVLLNKFNIEDDTFDHKIYENAGFIVGTHSPTPVKSQQKYMDIIENYLNKENRSNHLSAPLNITIYPSFACQADCEFCYVKNYCNEDLGIMSLESLKRLIDEIEDLQVPYVSILGGEPLLLPYIEKLLDYMSKKNIVFNITTNGFLLNDKIIYYVRRYKNIHLSVSLQSVDDYHTSVTKINYKNILSNIRKAEGNCRINTVFFKQSLKQLESLVDFVYCEGIKSFTIVLYNNIMLDPQSQINNHVRFLKTKLHLAEYIRQKNYNINFRAEGCLQYLFENNVEIFPRSDIEKIFAKCEAGNLKLEILPNGDTIGCTALNNSSFKSGNVFKNKLKDIWDYDDKLNLLRDSLCKDEECNNCRYYSFCNGGCPAQRSLKNKKFEIKRDSRCLMKI